MIVGTGGFDPEAAMTATLAQLTARLTALVTGPCAGFMAAQATIITPPPPPDPSQYVSPADFGGGADGGGDGAY